MKGKNHTVKEPSTQLPAKFNAQENLPIRTISKHIIHGCIALIPTVECILSNPLISAFRHKRHTIDKSYNIMNCRLTTVNHHRKLLKNIWGWKPNFFPQVIMQRSNCEMNHVAQYTRTCRWCNTKKQARIFAVFCVAQVKEKQAQMVI